MSLKRFFLVRRLSWPMALSLSLHAWLIAGLLYAAHHEVPRLPTDGGGQLQAIMVNPAMFAAAGVGGRGSLPTPPEALAPPQQRPLLSAPSLAAKTSLLSTSSSPEATPAAPPAQKAPARESARSRQREVKTATPPAARHPTRQDEVEAASTTAATEHATAPQASAPGPQNRAPSESVAASAGNPAVDAAPQAVSRQEPLYPQRALALHIEGRVKLRFDVDEQGRVSNVSIVSADPVGVFEREVKRAAHRWRYQPGRPGQNVEVTIHFRIDGRTALE